MARVPPQTEVEVTAWESGLFLALLVTGPLKLIVMVLLRGDGATFPHPATGRVYEIVLPRGGRPGAPLWVDYPSWIVDQVTSWILYINVAALVEIGRAHV